MDERQTPTTEAGHFKHTTDKVNASLGGNEIWYDGRNLNGQCSRCNRHNSGELDLYALYLEKKHGAGILQELEQLFRTPKKWTMEELIETEKFYNEAFEALAFKGLGVISNL